jgi:hypothetical protein
LDEFWLRFCWIAWHHIPENSNQLEGHEVLTVMVIFWGTTALFASGFLLFLFFGAED